MPSAWPFSLYFVLYVLLKIDIGFSEFLWLITALTRGLGANYFGLGLTTLSIFILSFIDHLSEVYLWTCNFFLYKTRIRPLQERTLMKIDLILSK